MATAKKGKPSQRPGQKKKEERGIKRKRDQDGIAELQSKIDAMVGPSCYLLPIATYADSTRM
jgi:hypothetical protein